MATRAAPLPPDERRAALVEATLPLLREYGSAVSTRQIATAAGVAEGTIFRAFGSKDALIDAAVEAALDPLPVVAALRGVDTGLPLEERLRAAVEVMLERLRNIVGLLIALRLHRPPAERPSEAELQRRSGANELILQAMADLLAPDADQLRHPPLEVARRIRLVTFSASHPMILEGRTLTAEDIVDFVLDGVRIHHPGDR